MALLVKTRFTALTTNENPRSTGISSPQTVADEVLLASWVAKALQSMRSVCFGQATHKAEE